MAKEKPKHWLAGAELPLSPYDGWVSLTPPIQDQYQQYSIKAAYLKAYAMMNQQEAQQAGSGLGGSYSGGLGAAVQTFKSGLGHSHRLEDTGPLQPPIRLSKENSIALEPGKVYLVFADPSKASFDQLAGLGVEDPNAPKVLFIPSKGGHTPSVLESIPVIEEWLAEQKARLEGK